VAAATKRFVDRTKHFVVATKYFCYPYILTNDFVGIIKPFIPCRTAKLHHQHQANKEFKRHEQPQMPRALTVSRTQRYKHLHRGKEQVKMSVKKNEKNRSRTLAGSDENEGWLPRLETPFPCLGSPPTRPDGRGKRPGQAGNQYRAGQCRSVTGLGRVGVGGG